MECPSCRTEVREGSKFCDECGAPVPTRCPACGGTNRAGAKFCSDCGAKLGRPGGSVPPPASAPGTTAAPRSSAERRQLTVLFCDLVGSTALSSRLDPEDLREIIGAYHGCVAETVDRLDGFVAKYMGDGVLVYFGYPQAHEDDPERAVRAGLDLVAAVHALKPHRDLELQCRVGLATGLVVVGDLVGAGEARERGIVGETPNLAARLQAHAAPGSVVIAESTHGLTSGLFEYQDLGPVEVRGFAEPIHAYEVLRLSPVESRFEALHGASLTPLVDREEEIGLLLRRWRRARNGKGQVVLLAGEPGIGKSRIATALQERLRDEPHTWLCCFCSPYHGNDPLHPIIGQLTRAAGLERDDAPEARLEKLEALLAPTSPPVDDVALLADLLSVPTAGRYPPLDLTPRRRKERTFEALLRQLELLAGQRPVLMVYEDVHWIDPTSRELLDLMVERVQRLPALLLVTFRPEFQPPWTGLPHVTALALSRLDRREGAALVEAVIGDRMLPADIVEEIIERADGVPLFVEELTKAVVEASAHGSSEDAMASMPRPALAVPATLHASLMTRLDRLGPSVRDVAQIGAAIGREFSYELLAAITGRSDAELQVALDRLVGTGLVFRRGTPPQSTYLFRHVLVQETAYGTLLRGRRQELHTSIAGTLEERWPDLAETQPELLAHHCTQASLVERAADYRRRAGERALRRSAITEAISHATKGIELVRTLPGSPAQVQRELDLQMLIGQAWIARRGYSARETIDAFARARVLVEALGDVSQQFPVLWGIWAAQHVGMALPEQQETIDQIFALAQQHPTSERLSAAHRVKAVICETRGELLSAREHLEQAIALYDPEQHGASGFTLGNDIGVSALSHLVWVLWLLGYPDQSMRRDAETLALAHRLAHKHSLAFGLWYSAIADVFRRDPARARERSAALLRLGEQEEFGLWTPGAAVIRGWAMTHEGQGPAGIEWIRRGIEEWTSVRAEMARPFFFGLLAEAYAAEGELRRGLDAITEGIEAVERTGQRWPEAELYRLRGELLAALPNGEAEPAFARAIHVARHQSAKSWELRAACGLARLWRAQGKRQEVRDLLAPVYGWFTEGFDTPDLREAKTLLDELR